MTAIYMQSDKWAPRYQIRPCRKKDGAFEVVKTEPAIRRVSYPVTCGTMEQCRSYVDKAMAYNSSIKWKNLRGSIGDHKPQSFATA